MGVLNPTILEGLDMLHATCAPACTLFDLPDVHVLAVERGPRSFTLAVETVPSLAGCPSCGVLATGHGRRKVLLHDLPCAGVPVRVVWHKRTYRCLEDACGADVQRDPRAGRTSGQAHHSCDRLGGGPTARP